jgi:hypothetical protein
MDAKRIIRPRLVGCFAKNTRVGREYKGNAGKMQAKLGIF